MVVKAGQVIPGDGEIIQGIASIDESAITGESAPVIREAGVIDPESPGAHSWCRTRSLYGSPPGNHFWTA